MMPEIAVDEIEKQATILSEPIFIFLIQSKATKACGCIEDLEKQKQCYSFYLIK